MKSLLILFHLALFLTLFHWTPTSSFIVKRSVSDVRRQQDRLTQALEMIENERRKIRQAEEVERERMNELKEEEQQEQEVEDKRPAASANSLLRFGSTDSDLDYEDEILERVLSEPSFQSEKVLDKSAKEVLTPLGVVNTSHKVSIAHPAGDVAAVRVTDKDELENIFEPSENEKVSIKVKEESRTSVTKQVGEKPGEVKEEEKKRDPHNFYPVDSTLSGVVMHQLVANADKAELESIFQPRGEVNQGSEMEERKKKSLLTNGLVEERQRLRSKEEALELMSNIQAAEERNSPLREGGISGWAGGYRPHGEGQLILPSEEQAFGPRSFGESGGVKRKRSQNSVLDREGENAIDEDNADEGKEDEKDVVIALLDEQVKNLVKALDFATKSQVEGSDRYIPLEIDHLKKAISVEEVVNTLRSDHAMPVPEENGNDDDDNVEDDYEKRTMVKKARDDLISEVRDEIEEREREEEKAEYRNAVRLYLESKLKERFREAIESEMEQAEVEVKKQAEAEAEAEEAARRERLREEYSRAFVREEDEEEGLGSPIGGYSKRFYEPEEEDGEGGEAEEGYNSPAELYDQDVCPAVDEFVTDCEFARSIGIGMDEEAQQLCNRHELCYACGSALGMDADNCDNGYLAESSQLCKTQECKRQAAALYVLMLEAHQFSPGSGGRQLCRQRCTHDYILGVD